MDNEWHPVFPIADMNTHPGPIGLTKRELFAAMAMQGLMSAYCENNKQGFKDADISTFAVWQADALLRALEDHNG